MKNRKPCEHGVVLPQSIRCDHGYIQVYMKCGNRLYSRNFGPHTKLAVQMAEIHKAERDKLTLMGKAGIEPELKAMSFKDVANIYFKWWCKETHPDGKLKHSQASQDECRRVLDDDLIAYFGTRPFDSIKPKDIEDGWRVERMKPYEWVSKRGKKRLVTRKSTSVDRVQGVLSSVFNKIKWLIDTERIEPFKVPAENPCSKVSKSAPNVRQRIPSDYELKKLKWAFTELGDTDGWEICKLALRSVLSLGDLKRLELGQTIDLDRAKTGVSVNLPIVHLVSLQWTNWAKRWYAALDKAGLRFPLEDPRNLQFRDFRKWGINQLKGKHPKKLISQFAGHAKEETTESFYMVQMNEQLKPLADDLSQIVEGL